MEKVVVDSDVVIDFLRTSSGLLPILVTMQSMGEIELFWSSMTVMELFSGESVTRQLGLVENLLKQFKIVPFDQVLARFVGEAKRETKTTVALGDFVIGMTAVWLRAKLATKNKKHFAGIKGLKFFSV